eukprot:TRINITY_DN4002_c0_g1_i1.p1 TRINITY_DN4002_c0_g1~~TRINITY_DN4002_c0_g1_i1.p1  ORF type:complete len:487 (-),score=76.38 TRINITY_DN4002_c0_g1_i1:103-1563(-)
MLSQLPFFSGEDSERDYLDKMFQPAVRNYRKILTINFFMNAITGIGESVIGAAGGSVILIITMWPSEPLTPDQIHQFAETYTFILGLVSDFFSEFFDVFSYINPLSTAFGNVKRIDQLLDTLDEYESESLGLPQLELTEIHGDIQDFPSVPVNLSSPKYTDGFWIEFKHVNSYIPISDMPLARDISFTVYPGENLIITGASGCGKSSLLRNLSGIWPITSGSIVRPKNIGYNGIMYMPQEPYFIIGSLKDQICYPEQRSDISDRTLQKYLDMVGLGHLTEKSSDEVVEWKRVLSRGEQQRLVMARLFYHRPKFALLDESTSALDHNWERILHKLCKSFHISLVSVGHRKSLFNYHEKNLHINADGTWEMRKTKQVPSKTEKITSHIKVEDTEDSGIPDRLYHVPYIPENKKEDTKNVLDARFFPRLWQIVKGSQISGRQLYINGVLLFSVLVMAFSDLGLSIGASQVAFFPFVFSATIASDIFLLE